MKLQKLLESWQTSIKPWLRTVVLSTLTVIGIMQTTTLVVKYAKAPVVTSVTLTPLTRADTPWLTICPFPGFNVFEVEKVFNAYNLSSKIPLRSLAGGLTLEFYGELLNATASRNVTMEQLVQRLITDPFVHGSNKYQFLAHGIIENGQSSDETRRASSLLLPPRSNEPSFFDSKVAYFENRLSLAKDGQSLRICTTSRPKLVLGPNGRDGYTLRFNVDLNPFFLINKTGPFSEMVLSGDFTAKFDVSILEPWKEYDPYQPFALREPGFTAEPGQFVSLVLDIQRYDRLSKPGDECSNDLQRTRQFSQCVLSCFESRYMAAEVHCRIPGYRRSPETLTSNPSQEQSVKPCVSADDFLRFAKHRILHSKKARRVHDECKSSCPSPCTRYIYGWKDDSSESQSKVIENRSSLLSGTGGRRAEVNIEMFVSNEYSKVVTESYAFTFVQLLSELGGSWGLLLGFSFVEFLPELGRFLDERLRK